MGKRVAIVGATGAVGLEMLRVLETRDFPVDELRCFASERSAGKELPFCGDTVQVERMAIEALKGMDLALYSAGSALSRRTAASLAADGTVVIDNSSAFRMDDDVPLIIPEINPEDVHAHHGIIANPNCSTIIMLLPIYPIYRKNRVRRIIVSTYQAVSGAGSRAMQELEEQTRDFLDGRSTEPRIFPHRIAMNLFSHDSSIQENGYCGEEMKMVNETRKILHDEDMRVSATTIRVSIPRAHSEAIHLELERPMSRAEAAVILQEAPGLRIVDDWRDNAFPMPMDAAGQDDILVGRIREDISCDRGLVMWVSGDQLLKGAALNAVQIAELLL